MIGRIRYFFLGFLVMLVTVSMVPLIGLAQPVRGGTLTVGLIAEPTTLDSCSGAWNSAPFAGNIMSSLLETDENMKIVPGIAESWSMDPRNKTYTFNLRKGVKWHDGKPLTAEDVKFTLEMFLPNYHIFGKYLKDTKVDIVSETRVVVKPGMWAPGIQLGRLGSGDWGIYP